MEGVLQLAGFIAFLSFVGLLVIAYIKWPGFRFWFFDVWADVPIIGMVARRLSHMSRPTTEEANRRLDELFRAYHLHIHAPISATQFDNYRAYLFLAGDSESKPIPVASWIFLFVLLSAEAFTFSFLLGVSISPDISQNEANIVAIVLAFLTAVVLALLSHPAGHMIKRTKELRSAMREAVDKASLSSDEKAYNVLTESVRLEHDQEYDKPLSNNFDSQRLLNRVRKTHRDDGSYILPTLFIITIVAIGALQFKMRYASLLIASGADATAPVWANSYFVILFFLTQGLALLQGYRYGFLGKESERAYRIVGDRDSYESYAAEYENRVRRADESIASLLSKFDQRYPLITPDPALFLDRVKRLAPPTPHSPGSPEVHAVVNANPPVDGSNVSQLPTSQTGNAA